MVFSASDIGTEHAEDTVRHGFVGIIVPSLWGGLGRGLTILVFSGWRTPPLRVKQLVVIPLLGVIADILDYFVIGMLTANNMFVIVTLPETDMKRREDPILNTTYIFIGSHSLKPLNNLV